MNLLQDVITYVRRIIKSPSDALISDNLIIHYINRFWINDVDARIQLFDLKSKYQFVTTPGVDRYNMPLYNIQVEGVTPDTQNINFYPVYQGFLGPCYVNGVEVTFSTQKNYFFNMWPNFPQAANVIGTGNGTSGPYTLTFPISPSNSTPANPPINSLLRGHVNTSGIIATGLNQDPPIGTTLDLSIPFSSISPAVYFNTTDVTGANMVVSDSGQFLTGNVNTGLLMNQIPTIGQGVNPFGYSALPGGYLNSFPITGITQAAQAVLSIVSNFFVGQVIKITGVVGMVELNNNSYTITAVTPTTVTIDVDSTGFTPYVSSGIASVLQNIVNYLTGTATNVYFPSAVPDGVNINGICYFFQPGLPRSILFYDNVITLRSPPDRQYLVEMDAYLSPAAYLNSEAAIQFGYMSEYIARGAARKILADTGDIEQFQFYEPLFREQEILVWKRSQRQFTSTRTQTIYSQGLNQGQSGFNNQGGAIY